MSSLCIICARKNSKGIKNKNFLKLGKQPLIFHTLNLALKSKLFNKVIVSSDSKKILNYSLKKGAHLKIFRPKHLCGDKVPKLRAIKHAFFETEKKFDCKFNFITDLDITSPLRNMTDLKKAFKLIQKSKKGNLITISESRKNPFFNMLQIKKNSIRKLKTSTKKIFSRQQAPKFYDMNASIYIWKRDSFLKDKKIVNKNTICFEMPLTRSIDIDTREDLKIVKGLWKKV